LKIFSELTVKKIDRRRDFIMVFNPSLDLGARCAVLQLKLKTSSRVSTGGH